MDPVILSNPAADSAIVAGLVTLVIMLVKIVERLVDWGLKKVTRSSSRPSAVVQLDGETSKMLMETSRGVKDIHAVIGRVDADGAPMVYASRTSLEMLREIAGVLQDVAHTQERLAASLDRLDQKFEQHDKTDGRTFGELRMSVDGLAETLQAHDRRAEQIQRDVDRIKTKGN